MAGEIKVEITRFDNRELGSNDFGYTVCVNSNIGDGNPNKTEHKFKAILTTDTISMKPIYKAGIQKGDFPFHALLGEHHSREEADSRLYNAALSFAQYTVKQLTPTIKDNVAGSRNLIQGLESQVQEGGSQ